MAQDEIGNAYRTVAIGEDGLLRYKDFDTYVILSLAFMITHAHTAHGVSPPLRTHTHTPMHIHTKARARTQSLT